MLFIHFNTIIKNGKRTNQVNFLLIILFSKTFFSEKNNRRSSRSRSRDRKSRRHRDRSREKESKRRRSRSPHDNNRAKHSRSRSPRDRSKKENKTREKSL